jgi:hypothetical protein
MFSRASSALCSIEAFQLYSDIRNLTLLPNEKYAIIRLK